MNLRFLFIGVTLLLIFSCKKGKITYLPCSHPVYINSYDTVFPSPYLMTYPGSWWEYSDGSIDSCYSWEQVSLLSLEVTAQCTSYVYDINILPFSSSVIFKNTYPISGLSTEAINNTGFVSYDSEVSTISNSIYTNYNGASCYTKLLGSNVGLISTTSKYFNMNSSSSKRRTKNVENIEHLDSLDVNGTVYFDVFHSLETDYMYHYHMSGGPSQRCHVYYAKDVGIIRREYSLNGGGGFGSFITQDLVNYHIEPY